MPFYPHAPGDDVRIQANTVASDVTINNSNVYTDITNLKVEVQANTRYLVQIALFASSAADADIDVQFTYPVGCTMTWAKVASWDSATAPKAITASLYISGVAVGTITPDYLIGVITNGANVGDLQVQFRQHTARVSNASIHAGSFITSIEGE